MHDNPWTRLPSSPPYVLDEERAIVEDFNRSNPDPATRIQLEVLPEPFLGRPDANVVVLSLNPGYDDSDREWHARADFAAAIHANLRHASQAYAFYPINPDFSQSGAYRWWRRRLDSLIHDTSLGGVADNLLCVELFPYHSKSYKAIPAWTGRQRLPSREYADGLVAAALERGASVIAMRNLKEWERRVPALRHYPKLHRLSSAQSAYLSPRNLSGYSSVVEALWGGRRKEQEKVQAHE
jgi:hypothetical protein